MSELFNKRNLLIGGAVVVGGLVIYTLASGATGGEGGTVTYQPSGPSPQQLQAATQLQLASISANARIGEAQIAAANNAADNNARLQALTLSAGLEKYRIDAGAADSAARVANEARANELSANLARYNLDTQVALQSNNNAFQLDYAQIAANTSIAISAQNAATMQTVLNSQTARDVARINAFRDVQALQIGAGVATAQLAAQDNAARLSFLNSNLPLLNKRNRDDILWLVAGGDTSHKTVQSDLSGVAQVFNAGANIAGSIAGFF
jgi:hypothetical protein